MIKVNKDLDVLFGGGLLPKNITHIYGVPASGKTNIALLAAAAAAKEGKVVFLDCEGGFSAERLKQISGDSFTDVLRKILLVEPTDFDEQKIAIKKITELASSEGLSLIIVDSISVLYRLEDERDTKELGRQISQLLAVARRNDIPVLMTNQVYKDPESGKIVPVGGDVTRYWSKVLIELEKDEESGLRRAVVRKHKFMPEGLSVRFSITGDGIKSYGVEYPKMTHVGGARVEAEQAEDRT